MVKHNHNLLPDISNICGHGVIAILESYLLSGKTGMEIQKDLYKKEKDVNVLNYVKPSLNHHNISNLRTNRNFIKNSNDDKQSIQELLNIDSNDEFINLKLGGFELNNLPHQHDDNFKVGFITKTVLTNSKELILKGVMGVDSIFKLYYNTPLVCYIIVSCNSSNVCFPIAFGLFKLDSSENLSEMIILLIEECIKFNIYDQNINTLIMIDKSPL